MKKLLLLFSLLGIGSGTFAQVYQFRFFGREEGLPQPFIYTIDQTPDGYLWLGTGEGLSRYDGTNFQTYTAADGLAEDFISCSYRDADNNLWFGHNQGGISRYNGNKFEVVIHGGSESSTITCLKEDMYGNIWASSQNNGMIRIDKNLKSEHFTEDFRDHIIYTFDLYKDKILLGTSLGLAVFNNAGNKPGFESWMDPLRGTRINYLRFDPATFDFWVATDQSGIFKIKPPQKSEGFTVSQVAPNAQLEKFNITHLQQDRFNNLWLSTFGNGLVQLIGSKANGYSEKVLINKSQGFPGNFIKATFEDREKNIWVATYGNGLALRINDYFSFYPEKGHEEGVSVVLTDHQGVWTGGKGWISFFPPLFREKKVSYSLPAEVRVNSLYKDGEGNVLAGTEGNGIWMLKKDAQKFLPMVTVRNGLEGRVNNIVSRGNEYFAATRGGIIRFDENGKITNWHTTSNGLLHNNINHIALDKTGSLWIAGMGGGLQVLYPSTGEIKTIQMPTNGLPINLNGVIPLEEGTWVSTNGSGVFLYTGDTILNFSSRQGLGSNYSYGIVADKRGYIWTMHRNTLTRISCGDYSIKTYSPSGNAHQDLGLTSGDADKYGNLWFASKKGLFRYSPDRDQKNMVPPILQLSEIVADDQAMQSGISPAFQYDTYRIRFSVKGLSLKDPDKIRYRYKLEGFEHDWTEPTLQTSAVYTRLPDGEYTFVAEAFNSDGIRTGTPLRVPFIVEKPFWKEWWFGLVMLGVIFQGVFMVVRFRERKHRELKILLENMLDERTREVTDKKNELERKNKDITDSISYARRIQFAVLPPENKLREYFNDSFIFYQPKDIVSGDFYWLKKFSNKILIACADATGHGVPGAFMSLIGSTLLKDITEMDEVSNPAEVLSALDNEVKTILSQHGSGTNDGMDIALAEFDLNSRLMRYSLAMRPLVIIRNGKASVHRGDRKAIGGKYMGDQESFTCHTMQLEPGDQVYLFSDGFHDQFGGENGKKLKMRPFIQLLEQISHEPSGRQGEILKEKFADWRGELEQVDDVLVIGIKV